jgi:hypothetical protein
LRYKEKDISPTNSDLMNTRKILSFLLLSLLLVAGCTKEDYRNCPAGLYVSFEPVNPKHNYPELVTKVVLYFYSPEGKLQASFNYSRDELRAYDRAAFVPQIPTGDYRLVAVINGEKDYETYGVDRYEDLYTQLKQETVNEKLTDLFTSEKLITVGRSGRNIQTENKSLVKHNSNIRLKILYDGYAAPAGITLKAFAEESSGIFHYSTYSGPATRYVRYLPWAELSGSNGLPRQFDISVFRLWIGGDASICLQEIDATTQITTGRSYRFNIAEELIKVKNALGEYLYDTNEKLEYNDEYEITITLGEDFVVLSLTIDNWHLIGGGVGV